MLPLVDINVLATKLGKALTTGSKNVPKKEILTTSASNTITLFSDFFTRTHFIISIILLGVWILSKVMIEIYCKKEIYRIKKIVSSDDETYKVEQQYKLFNDIWWMGLTKVEFDSIIDVKFRTEARAIEYVRDLLEQSKKADIYTSNPLTRETIDLDLSLFNDDKT
jgi:hypothetical protein